VFDDHIKAQICSLNSSIYIRFGRSNLLKSSLKFFP